MISKIYVYIKHKKLYGTIFSSIRKYIYNLQKYSILQRNSSNSKILISMKLCKKFIKIYAEHNKLNMKQFFYRNENLIEGMKSILKFLTFFSIFDKISLKFFLAKNIYK